MSKKHEINIREEETNRKEEALERKKEAFESEKRRFSQDLATEAVKLASELNGYEKINQQLKFDDIILEMLNRSMNFQELQKSFGKGINPNVNQEDLSKLHKLERENSEWREKYNEALRKEKQIQNVEQENRKLQQKLDDALKALNKMSVKKSKKISDAPMSRVKAPSPPGKLT